MTREEIEKMPDEEFKAESERGQKLYDETGERRDRSLRSDLRGETRPGVREETVRGGTQEGGISQEPRWAEDVMGSEDSGRDGSDNLRDARKRDASGVLPEEEEGVVMPPQGEIDSSVLMLFGQILVYAGSVFGVKVYIANLLNRRK